MAAELTNHLVSGAVLTPGIVATGRVPLREMSTTMHKRSFRAALTAAAFLLPILAAPTFAAQPAPEAKVFSPWQHGANNEARTNETASWYA